jgi:hypothetical protein
MTLLRVTVMLNVRSMVLFETIGEHTDFAALRMIIGRPAHRISPPSHKRCR